MFKVLLVSVLLALPIFAHQQQHALTSCDRIRSASTPTGMIVRMTKVYDNAVGMPYVTIRIVGVMYIDYCSDDDMYTVYDMRGNITMIPGPKQGYIVEVLDADVIPEQGEPLDTIPVPVQPTDSTQQSKERPEGGI